MLVGPPIAGALDARFGFRGPFVLGVALTSLELICRLLIIEHKDAALWDDAPLPCLSKEKNDSCVTVLDTSTLAADESGDISEPSTLAQHTSDDSQRSAQQPGALTTMLRLITCPRAMAPVFMTFVYG